MNLADFLWVAFTACVFALGWQGHKLTHQRELKNLTRDLGSSSDTLQEAVNRNKETKGK